MKRFVKIIMCFVLIFSMAGCGNQNSVPLVNEDGSLIHYTEQDLPEGYHILKDDGYYYKFLNAVTPNTDNHGNLYIWFTEDYEAAIPRFTAKDKLFYYSETARPLTITLHKFTDYGYTIGAMFTVSNNTGDIKYPRVINFSGTYNQMSPVASAVGQVVTQGATTYLTGINNYEFTSNLLVNDSFLKGLTKDTMYQISMYCGTVAKKVNLKADTHLFIQESTFTSSGYDELKAKCFEIYLPDNLTPGYYYIDSIGMFYFEGEPDFIDDDEDVIID